MLLLYNSQKIQYQIYSHSADWKAVFLAVTIECLCFLEPQFPPALRYGWCLICTALLCSRRSWSWEKPCWVASLNEWQMLFLLPSYVCPLTTHTHAFTRTHGQDPELLTSLVGLLTSLLDTPKLIVLQIIFRTSQKGMGKSNWSEQLLLNNCINTTKRPQIKGSQYHSQKSLIAFKKEWKKKTIA